MKIIGIAALAIALSAFAARAQTTTTNPSSGDSKGTAVLPADQNSSALPGNSSNTASSNQTLPSNDPKANGTPAADVGAKTSQTQPDDSSNRDNSSSAVPNKGAASTATGTGTDSSAGVNAKDSSGKTDNSTSSAKTKKSKKHSTAQGRSGSDSMHQTRTTPSDTPPTTSGTDTGSSGSVARPPAPDTSVDQKPTKDPGMSSRPGDVTGQPTDTQKPVDTAPSSNQPKDR
jgi:hypothetical protein